MTSRSFKSFLVFLWMQNFDNFPSFFSSWDTSSSRGGEDSCGCGSGVESPPTLSSEGVDSC